MAKTITTRVSERVHQESRQFAGLLGIQSSEVIDRAWDEFLENHREEFAENLEQLAGLIRNGTTSDLGDYLGAEDREARAEAYVESARAKAPQND